MYLFFMVSGYLFVVGFSILLDYLYELFSINKFTKFLNPLNNSIFSEISYCIIPNILWSMIELAMLGTNYYFLLGFILNIFVNLGVMYVIRFGYTLISNKESHIVNILSIMFASFFGFVCNYLCLLIGVSKNINILYSLVGVIIIIIIFLLIKIFPPKNDFFRGTNIN